MGESKVLYHLYHTRIDLPWGRILTNYPEFVMARIQQLFPGMECKVFSTKEVEDDAATSQATSD